MRIHLARALRAVMAGRLTHQRPWLAAKPGGG
jgi:hypothetical protein